MSREPAIGNIVIITAREAKEVLLLHKPPYGEIDIERAKIGKRPRIGIGKWGCPGGGKEEGETDVQAAQRELFQETNLSFPLVIFRKIGMLKGFRQTDNVEPIWNVTIYSVSMLPGMFNHIKIDPREHDKSCWFRTNRYPDEMPWGDMIESDKKWLPMALGGMARDIEVSVVFKGMTEEVLSCDVREAGVKK